MRVLLRRRQLPWAPLSEQYEWRRSCSPKSKGKKYIGKIWYRIRGEDIKPVTRIPETFAFMRDLFNRLRNGEVVEVEAEYNRGAWGRSLIIAMPLLAEV